MNTILIDGKATAAKLRLAIAADAARLTEAGHTPALAVILVGEDPASAVYVRNKHRACAECGIDSKVITLPAATSEEALLATVEQLNRDPEIDGILVQLPLPPHIRESAVIAAIDPDKDVDAFHPINAGRLLLGAPVFAPCTPAGVMALLDEYGIDPDGKHCVVIGRSNIVGKPQALLLLQRNATVTVCHSHTRNLKALLQSADIIVAAVGRAGFVTGDMIREGAVVIDVGINRRADGKLCGDCDFATVSGKAGWLTPVPGGVGPMTITMLLRNTITAAARR